MTMDSNNVENTGDTIPSLLEALVCLYYDGCCFRLRLKEMTECEVIGEACREYSRHGMTEAPV